MPKAETLIGWRTSSTSLYPTPKSRLTVAGRVFILTHWNSTPSIPLPRPLWLHRETSGIELLVLQLPVWLLEWLKTQIGNWTCWRILSLCYLGNEKAQQHQRGAPVSESFHGMDFRATQFYQRGLSDRAKLFCVSLRWTGRESSCFSFAFVNQLLWSFAREQSGKKFQFTVLTLHLCYTILHKFEWEKKKLIKMCFGGLFISFINVSC